MYAFEIGNVTMTNKQPLLTLHMKTKVVQNIQTFRHFFSWFDLGQPPRCLLYERTRGTATTPRRVHIQSKAGTEGF